MLRLVPGFSSVCIISGVPVMEAPHAKGSGVQQAVPITYYGTSTHNHDGIDKK
jgi:hypothetical protein